MVLELPDLHHFAAGKVSCCMLGHSILFCRGKGFESHANKSPVAIGDIRVM
jgi:hypothetical protein